MTRILATALWTLILAAAPAAAQTVVRVIDGDTYELDDGRRVRLIGVDTPEKHRSAKLDRDAERTGRDTDVIRALGEAASLYAKALVEGKAVRLEFDPANAASSHKDRYGRTLAYVWLAGHDGREFMVNLRLIEAGYASAYTSFPFRYMDAFLRAQRQAREAGRGLWGDGGLGPPR